MKKASRILIIHFILLLLFSSTAVAVDNDHPEEYSFVPGHVIVKIKENDLETDSYENLFPELDIDEIKNIRKLETGETTMLIILSEKTTNAVLNAITALDTNPYVIYATVDSLAHVDIIAYPILKGDANCDGKLANDDLILVAQHIVGIKDFYGNQYLNTDIDDDGKITNIDLISIAKMIVSKE